MHPAPFLIGPAFVLLIFIGVSTLVGSIVATLGWRRYAKRYGTSLGAGKPRCTAYNVRFTVRPMAYNNVVQLSFLPEGLRFSMPRPFRSGHAPFLLPYASVRALRRKSGWLRESLEVRLEAEEGEIHLRLPLAALAMFEARGVHGEGAAGGAPATAHA
jgi:hypothetical protein